MMFPSFCTVVEANKTAFSFSSRHRRYPVWTILRRSCPPEPVRRQSKSENWFIRTSAFSFKPKLKNRFPIRISTWELPLHLLWKTGFRKNISKYLRYQKVWDIHTGLYDLLREKGKRAIQCRLHVVKRLRRVVTERGSITYVFLEIRILLYWLYSISQRWKYT